MPAIVFSEKDIAGKNIAEKLIERYGLEKVNDWEWKGKNVRLTKVKEDITHAQIDFVTDYVICASRHKSESKERTLCVHVPGNWGRADLGGEEKTLSTVYASKMKVILKEIKKLAQEMKLDWTVCMEVDHHGPTVEMPIMFVEIGSGEEEWRNEKAAEIIAESIMKGIESSEEFESAFGVGGGHYAPLFTKIMLEDKIAVGHMLPKYQIDEVGIEILEQAFEKSVEPVERAVLDWKGMSSEQRKRMIALLEEMGKKWERG